MRQFAKYHGAGNDFILLKEMPENPSSVAIALCDRNFGIGADGLLIASKSTQADLKMTYLNQDGSYATMCGNGLRCFTQFAYDEGLIHDTAMTIETDAGILTGMIQTPHQDITVYLGAPRPLNQTEYIGESEQFSILDSNQEILVETLFVSTVHAVVILKDSSLDIIALGPLIESHPRFPQRINVNFVQLIDDNSIAVTTYERGAGWTKACGSGVMASAILAQQRFSLNHQLSVTTPGGILHVNTQDVTLTGNAIRIAKGDVFV